MPNFLTTSSELSAIKLLCCDVDGVMTDGGLYYTDSGETMKRFHVLDGQGLKMIQNIGVKTAFISQSTNNSIKLRANALGINYCYTGIEDKLQTVEKICAELKIKMSEVAHIADDVNDMSLLEKVGIPITVPNGVFDIKEIAKFITKNPGGQGAVRELCEAILSSKLQT